LALFQVVIVSVCNGDVLVR